MSHASRETYSEVPLFTRHPANPILSRKDWPYPINSVFNAGAVRLDDGELCCSAASKTGAACRTFAPPAPPTESMVGASIPSRL